MPSTQLQTDDPGLAICPDNIGELLDKEWLLTNDRGSYASGTVLGCNTRRYHGLLVASLHPPVERMVMLSNLLETVQFGGCSYDLSNFEFSDRLHPQGYRFLKHFRRDAGVHFCYELDGLKVEKSIYLAHDRDLLVVCYDFSGVTDRVRFTMTPLVALRDFHSLQSSSTCLTLDRNNDVFTVHVLDPHGPAVHFICPQSTFESGANWWYAMRYRREAERGQHNYEDVWAAGVFNTTLNCPSRVMLIMQATAGLQRPGPLEIDVDGLIRSLHHRRQELFNWAETRDDYEKTLAQAADQFIVHRQINDQGHHSTSVMAGYHWFADWGRDTFVSLPGLLLSTGRFAEAHEAISTFGAVLDRGQIPNRFDDYGGAPHYNSVDASLWYINAAYQYLLATDDQRSFQEHFRPVIVQITGAYLAGTRDNIHADEDGLIIAGDAHTQLTWMDAKCNNVAFTPRYGKAVEINALWINALHIMAQTAVSPTEREHYLGQLERVEDSFRRLFWNDADHCLYDCIFPDGLPDATIRPNQIFAVSLPFSALTADQRIAVVRTVEEHLLTPYGLRSLSPRDSRYQGHYSGNQFQRDSAYHQGTVWAYLLGPFIEAFLKVNDFSAAARDQAYEMITPLLDHLDHDGCLGSVSEIFDGDFPHRPKGCIAQAWSVAELLRCKKMLR
jgi:predicted glycogen debranching enzyme